MPEQPSSYKVRSRLDIPVEELVAALNDPEKAEALMKAKGLSKKDLVSRAELLTKELSAGISAVNIV